MPLSPVFLLEISSLFGKRALTIIYSPDGAIAQKLALHNRTWGQSVKQTSIAKYNVPMNYVTMETLDLALQGSNLASSLSL